MPTLARPRRRHTRPARVLQTRLAAAEQALGSCQRELAALQRLSTLALPAQPLPAALEAAAQELGAATSVPIVVIERYDAVTQQLACVAATGIAPPDDPVGRRLPAAQSLAGQVTHSGQVIITTHIQDPPLEGLEALGRLGAQTVACLPLAVAEHVVGTVTLAHPDAGALDSDRVALAQRLVAPIATLVARDPADALTSADARPLRAILDQLAAGVFQIDAAGRYHYVNRRVVEPIGLTPDAVIGKSILEILPPADAQAELERYRRIIASGRTTEYEVTFETPQGPWTYVMVGQVLTDPQGDDPTLLVSGVDITAYTQAAAALQVALTKYRTLFDSFPLGISVCDATGQIVEANRMAESLLGLGADEHRQRTIDDAAWQIVRPDGSPMPAEEYASVRALHEQRHVENVEMGVRTPSGTTIWLTVTAAPLPLDDGGVVITYGDITEQRQAEQLVAAQRDLARLIATTTDPHVAWPRCLALAMQACALDCGGLYLFDAAAQALDLVAHQGLAAAFVQATARYALDTTNAQLLLAGEAVYWSAADLQQLAVFRHETLTCAVIMPIQHQGRILGCVNLASHTLPEVPAFARHALETIAIEIANIVVALRTTTALRLSEKHYRELMESLGSMVFTLDASGTLQYVNQLAAQQFGGTPQDFVGKRSDALLPAAVVSTHSGALRRVLTDGAVAVYEDQVPVQGQLRWHRISFHPIHDEQGRVLVALVNATDIHDLKTTQEELRALNQTLEARVAERTAEVQDLYDHAPTGYYALDSAGQISNVNQTLLDWLGYTRAEVLGRPFLDLVPPADQAIFAMGFPAFQARGWLRDQEGALLRKDGSTFAVLLNATAVYDANGGYTSSRATVFDNTERRNAEDALRESEARYRTLVEQMSQGVLVYQDEQVVFGNATAAQIIGCSVADLQRTSLTDLTDRIHADDRHRVLIPPAERPGADSITAKPFRFTRIADRALRWVLATSTIITSRGRPAVLAVFTDVTALKETEERLRLSEARLQLLLAKTPAVIFSSLAEPDFRTTFISESVRQVLGYAPAQFMSSPGFWASRIHPKDKPRVFGDAARLVAQGWCQYEYRCRHADGSDRWVESGVSLLPATTGHPAEVIGYMIDITPRKEAEALLQHANAELARAAQAKDDFLANMSHELRSPLTAILGFSESLQEGIYEPLTARQQGTIRHIETSGRHLLALINDLLDLAKGEVGKLTLEVARISIGEICQASLLFVKELAHRKALQLSLTLPGVPATMEADPRRVKQMLINLLANAVKFTPDGGQVSLEVSIDGQMGEVRFAVRDTGIGITPEAQVRLFQPFVQLDSSLSRQHAGTGLGLALVRRLAELHGGRVTLQSAVGVGSCFTLILPFSPPTPGEPARTTLPEPGGDPHPALAHMEQPHDSGAHILLVEDNAPSIQVTSEYLQARGFVVNVAQTGPEALALAVAQPPDLILMDIQLPELDGLEVIRQLRALPPFARTPIIALTALAMPGDQERCLAAGASAYLTKPVRWRELLETISRLLQP